MTSNHDPNEPRDESVQAKTESAAAAALQFDHVEPAQGSAEGAGGLACTACKQPILGEYFEINSQMTCPSCRSVIERSLTGPVGLRVWLSAVGRGAVAAALGALIYFAVLKITGYELGLISIVVGVLVGTTVRKASGGRGGWRFQALAMGLTYLAIVSSYMPSIYEAIVANHETKGNATSSASSGEGAVDDAEGKVAGATADDRASPSPGEPRGASDAGASKEPAPTFFGALWGLLVACVFLLCLAAAAPILAGFENFMGWVIIAIALYEAWKLNKRVDLRIHGPFRVGGEAPAAPAAGSAGDAA